LVKQGTSDSGADAYYELPNHGGTPELVINQPYTLHVNASVNEVECLASISQHPALGSTITDLRAGTTFCVKTVGGPALVEITGTLGHFRTLLLRETFWVRPD
jgi:hypothetical protein